VVNLTMLFKLPTLYTVEWYNDMLIMWKEAAVAYFKSLH